MAADTEALKDGEGDRRARAREAAARRAAIGRAAEDAALAWLQRQGLTLLLRNYRVARGPSAHGGEIDLILQAADGTVVFVEVRARRQGDQGGAAASVTRSKQRSLIHAARQFLNDWPGPLPPCRFDVVAFEGSGAGVDDTRAPQEVLGTPLWLPGAFDASA